MYWENLSKLLHIAVMKSYLEVIEAVGNGGSMAGLWGVCSRLTTHYFAWISLIASEMGQRIRWVRISLSFLLFYILPMLSTSDNK